jgi:predicted XRE-type DNA-binding protein
MTEQETDFELVRGSENVFQDHCVADPEMRQLRAILAAEVIKTLDARGLSTREAHKVTGVAAADFSRIRNVKLKGFTIDRLMTSLTRLNREIDIMVAPLDKEKSVHFAGLSPA